MLWLRPSLRPKPSGEVKETMEGGASLAFNLLAALRQLFFKIKESKETVPLDAKAETMGLEVVEEVAMVVEC